jgi:hypothetical protein
LLHRVCAHHMRANAWIMAAEGLAEMTVAGHVIGFEADPAIGQRLSDIAAEKAVDHRQ